ncbi:dihydrodipicolinate synthase family protein [Halobacteriales archaeon QS_5_70_15]|nr:MAG: dihydrodipicolinate synthase family protein [Halobacteriales archaeon QS_5_70_15]
MRLEGTIPPMVTPTEGRDGGVDTPALRAYTEFLVEGGVHGLFPCGSIGEFPSLTRAERRTVVETVAKASGDVPVLAGCGATSVGDVVALTEDAAAAGASAAVVVTPYYLGVDQAGLRGFYEAVADRSPLPIVLYNIPQRTGVTLDVGTTVALAEHGNVVGVKDSSGKMAHVVRLFEETPEEFSVVQGLSMLALPSLDGGAAGLISGAANVFPAALSALYEAHRAGEHDRAVDIANEVANPLVTAYADLPTAPALKHLVDLAGHEVGPPVLPLSPLDPEARTALTDRYERVRERAEARSLA